ncbi:hypothetical protein BC477_19920 [Clavibacter michiganensis subsp. michiganensis]|uniref:Uncharacterized protein n=1 Tax=Clavibacter michiganensis subsp. michiganensis TaxID=33013 RepID=A0A251XCQ8_CLAMM|nr:hypothetical protein BC477_19920 [Clavibacter michiganensis subsp. michiganensis]OUD99957.1 hypothetical protein CMMCAS07_19460 [Clavibacter michiganensis subsp. michiganensis]
MTGPRTTTATNSSKASDSPRMMRSARPRPCTISDHDSSTTSVSAAMDVDSWMSTPSADSGRYCDTRWRAPRRP